ncbi:uncharacterized protein [Oscarella lobularis]
MMLKEMILTEVRGAEGHIESTQVRREELEKGLIPADKSRQQPKASTRQCDHWVLCCLTAMANRNPKKLLELLGVTVPHDHPDSVMDKQLAASADTAMDDRERDWDEASTTCSAEPSRSDPDGNIGTTQPRTPDARQLVHIDSQPSPASMTTQEKLRVEFSPSTRSGLSTTPLYCSEHQDIRPPPDPQKLISYLLRHAKNAEMFLRWEFGNLHKLRSEVLNLCWKTSAIPIILLKAVYESVHSSAATPVAQNHVVEQREFWLLDECCTECRFGTLITKIRKELAEKVKELWLAPEELVNFQHILYITFVKEHYDPKKNVSKAWGHCWDSLHSKERKADFRQIQSALEELASDVVEFITCAASRKEKSFQQYNQLDDFKQLFQMCAAYSSAICTTPK